jgi:threonine dehydratase
MNRPAALSLEPSPKEAPSEEEVAPPPTFADVEAAAARMSGIIGATPTVWSEGRAAFLKLENRQVTGSFKVRGAFNAMAVAHARGDRRAVVAASAGNHGRGVAWAARHFGLRATIFVPRGAPRAKIDGARELGALVCEAGASFEDCLASARAHAALQGERLVHAFDDAEVVAGQGTVALELLDARPDVVVVPVGGGGLAAGMGLVLRRHGVRLVGAQVRGADAMRQRLAGVDARVPPVETIADGLRVLEPGHLTRALCAAALDEIVLVEEADVRATMADLFARDGLLVEGAGAVAVAALAQVTGARRVAVISGGNIDPATFASLTARG